MDTSVCDGVSGEEDHRPGSRSWLGGCVVTGDSDDDSIRWRPGERLEHLFEERCDWLRRHGQAGHLAVDAAGGSLSYAELDARANQLARFLIRRGVRPGDRIGLLSDVAVDGYVGMLAVLKAHAAFVPLDVSFPADRVGYIAADAGVRLILTRSHIAARLGPVGRPGRAGVRGPGRGPDRRRTRTTRSPWTRCRRRPTSLLTSSTRPARRAGPRAWPSATRASATSSG